VGSTSQAYTLDNTAPTTTIATLAFSADTGSSSTDFITKTASQTISGTLSAVTVAGEKIQVSLDNGSTWVDATNTIGEDSWSLAGQTLTASNTLKARVVDAANNAGTVYSQAYVLDQTGPAITFSGLVLSADTGISSTDFITKTAAQTITATLSAAPAGTDKVWGSLDGGTNWIDITSMVSGTALTWTGVTLVGSDSIKLKVTDNAANDSVLASQAFALDTANPTASVTTANVGIGTNVTTAQSTETGTLYLVKTTDSPADYAALEALVTGGTASKSTVAAGGVNTTINTTGLAVGTYKVYSSDAAGNISSASAGTITLGTPPAITGATIAFSADTGTSTSDLTTKTAAQNLSGTLTGVTVVGDVVQVSLDNGTTWVNATNTIGQNSWTLAGQTLVASDTLQVRVTNNGFDGSAYSQTYVFDTTAPTSSVTTANVTIGTNVTTAQSTETGIVYLVKSTDTPADYAALENLVTGGTATKATVIAGGSNTVIFTSGLAAGSYKIYSVDAAGNVSNISDNTVTLVANHVPTLGSIPGSTQQVTTAVVAALPDFTVADTDGGTLTVTLAATNGTIGGLTDADPATPGIQLTGTAAQINTALAAATFTATTNGAAAIDFSLSDGVAAAVIATYSLNATTPVVPPVDPPVDPPVTPPADDDNDGITADTENQVPTLPPTGGGTAVVGDGNGDGVADNQQASVTSVPFLKTDTAVSNPTGAPPVYVTLVADSNAGVTDTTDTNSAQLTSVQQKDAPTGLPSEMLMPLGLISFVANVGTAGITETFSLFVDSSISFNGYWKQDKAGTWCNIATAIETVGGKTRIDFAITDGGAFDADGKADGIITDPGAIGSMPLSMVGELPVTTGTGFWF
jgi:hypothetical protein